MAEWLPLDEFVITPEINTVHCDTRDFHVVCVEDNQLNDVEKGEVWDKTALLRKIAKGIKKEFLMTPDAIRPFLKGLFEMSGGEKDWRFLSFSHMNPDNDLWLKYIRFYRYPKDPNFFIVCDQYNALLPYERCIKKHLKRDY